MTPSERLLSLRSRPGGSFAAGILALRIALQMMSLTMFCRLIIAALWRHERPWITYFPLAYHRDRDEGQRLLLLLLLLLLLSLLLSLLN